MLKRISAIFTLGVLLLPTLVLGAVGYERTPAGYTITNPVSFAISGVFEEYPPANSWRLRYNMIDGECATTTNALFEEILPLGNYWQVQLLYYSNDYCGYPEIGGLWFEYDGGNTVFEVVEEAPPAEGVWLTIPAGFISTMQGYVGGLFTDLTIPILLIIGLPLAFWFIAKVIGLVRGGFRTPVR